MAGLADQMKEFDGPPPSPPACSSVIPSEARNLVCGGGDGGGKEGGRTPGGYTEAVAPDITGEPGLLGKPAYWPALAGILSALFPPLYPAAPSFLPGLNYR